MAAMVSWRGAGGKTRGHGRNRRGPAGVPLRTWGRGRAKGTGMSALVLTLVLALVWALFIALGYWHGGWREVVALAGILLSYAVLSEWAGPNGRDLSAAFGWSLARSITGVALAYLIG